MSYDNGKNPTAKDADQTPLFTTFENLNLYANYNNYREKGESSNISCNNNRPNINVNYNVGHISAASFTTPPLTPPLMPQPGAHSSRNSVQPFSSPLSSVSPGIDINYNDDNLLSMMTCNESYHEFKTFLTNIDTYPTAYMYLDVPSIFSPYVRLELLKWDPLHQDVDFCDMKWHGLLFDNGKPEDVDDTDANLVSELVEKFAIPIFHHWIVCCWDVLNTRETRNVVAATSMVKGYVPASSEALAELFAAIRARLVEAIAAITVPTWEPMVLKVVPNASQAVAYRFGTSVRLMRNICMWKDILALPVLENLAL